MSKHLAEMLLDLKLHGRPDSLRKRKPFSDDMKSVHAVLFDPDVPKLRKLKVYRNWLQNGQPCVFGRVAAKNEHIFICLIEEHEVLRMRSGDADLRDTIQDSRQTWKRYALDGRHSSFLILLVSPTLVEKEPGDALKEVCRRLMELYMEIEPVLDDTIHAEREYVFLRGIDGDAKKVLRFSTLPNVFCAQGDGRWWHDHRTPGGIMITSNALGHFVRSRSPSRSLNAKDTVGALENAMRTINNAFVPSRKTKALAHCPATSLHLCAADETSPAKGDLGQFSGHSYSGYFHTDHLIPSIFFYPGASVEPKRYDDLDLRYIHDAAADPQSHLELMAGEPCKWYDVHQNLSRLPGFVNPEKTGILSDKQRGQLSSWAEQRLKSRLG